MSALIAAIQAYKDKYEWDKNLVGGEPLNGAAFEQAPRSTLATLPFPTIESVNPLDEYMRSYQAQQQSDKL